MAGSQLKRLKASLRDQGITGPQKSKKQRRKLAQDDTARNDKRLQRGVVLEGIREQFNPFDLKHAARGPKFEVTTNKPKTSNASVKGRPGLAKAASEEKRKQTLLVDMQRRNKVGGILDRRFGENDPTMTPEEKMLERFAREKQKTHNKKSAFDLEDEDPMDGLTHMGRSLNFGEEEELADDFQEDDLKDDEDSDGDTRETRLKRLRAIIAAGEDEGGEDGEPERKKTKKEVMEEVIAKSKLHKYERQAAKDNDDDLRMELDKELTDIRRLLWSGLNGGRHQENAPLSTIAGVDRDAFDKNFDIQVKKLSQDKKAQPSNRTKTDEEKAEDESTRLKKLEDKRQKRMMGEEVSDSDEDEDDKKKHTAGGRQEDDEDEDDDDGFGLGHGIKTRPTATELGFDDEDDFVIDDDLVASGSDIELVESDDDSDEEEEDDSDSANQAQVDEDDDDEFTRGLLNESETKDPIFQANFSSGEKSDENGLPFTFPCPQSCAEFVSVTKDYGHTHLPKIVQRIRALHHPKLDSKNKERLANFSVALVDFVALPWNAATSPPFSVLESLIRHIHSLSKMFSVEIAKQFRQHLEEISESRPIALLPSDLTVLTAIGTIYPTSDHFHQVVTPAMLTIGRYIGQKVPRELSDYAIGTYLSILCLQFQQLSKRYAPEVINFALNTICSLSPVAPSKSIGNFPVHEPSAGSRIQKAKKVELRRLNFSDCLTENSQEGGNALKLALLGTTIQVLDAAADLWTGKPAFLETFGQVVEVLSHVNSKPSKEHLPTAASEKAERLEEKLKRMSRVSQLSRRPLELHHHKPLSIKTYIPKFEDTFDPDKHYDPDRERAEMAKLKKEHKKERKGAMRELRKDANFMARENLRIKKVKDEAYEKKYKRLVAEIQNEEGREANNYEREQKARKRANARK